MLTKNLLSLCVLVLATAAHAGGKDAMERLRADGDVARAKIDLLRGLLANPKSQAAFFNLAAIAERERDWPTAMDFYQRAVDVDPSSETGRSAANRLATVKRIAGLSVEQLRYEVGLARAAEARSAGRTEAAATALQSAMRIAPERWEAPAMLGAIFAESGNTIAAAEQLRTARRNAPAEDKARFDRAIETVLASSGRLLDESLAKGARQTADVERLSREMLAPRGGERIKEASALLVARDIEGAVSVLRGALSEAGEEGAIAARMLRELVPVSVEAKRALEGAPAIFSVADAGKRIDALLRDAVTDDIRRTASAPPTLVEDVVAPTAAAVPAEPANTLSSCPAPPMLPSPVRAALVQVGAYREPGGAEALARTLASKGYEASTEADGSVYRVVVGPFPSDKEASEVRKRLAHDGYKPFVRTRSGD